MPLARERGVGTLLDEPGGSGGSDGPSEALLTRMTEAESLHYTLTVDPDVALPGPSFLNE
jgi:hypothetical protein